MNTLFEAAILVQGQEIALCAYTTFGVGVSIAHGSLIGVMRTYSGLLFGLKVLIVGRFEVKMRFSYFGSWRVGWLNRHCLAS